MTGHKSAGLLLGIIVSVLLAGCVTAAAVKKPSAPIRKMALVSLTVSNWMGMVSGTAGDAKAAELINSTFAGLLNSTEHKLAGVKPLNKLSGFIDNPTYRSFNVKSEVPLMFPKVGGTPVVNFSKTESDVITANLNPETAKKLCATLQVDAVVVIYSEWAAAQGHFVPMRRALAKNVVSVWDRNGNLIFNTRVDEMSEAVVGGPYVTVVNVGTIRHWAEAYNKSLDQIVTQMKAALK
jgi:hypothetical protein